jgi:hypothetical protein
MTTNVSGQSVTALQAMQAAWGGFIKDPWHVGPGWDRVDAEGRDLACFGCGSGTEARLIDEQKVDGRCPFYKGTYHTVKTPYFWKARFGEYQGNDLGRTI